jgi:hypothetical protein
VGDAAAVAVDNHGNCVAVRSYQGNLFGRAGRLDPINRSVRWTNETQLGSGTTAAVSLDNDAHAVAVNADGGRLFYRLGALDPSGPTVDWSAPIDYGAGETACVALADYGLAVGIHVAGHQVHCQVASVEDNGTITWLSSAPYGPGESASIAVDNVGNCIATTDGVAGNAGKLFYRVGKVEYVTSFDGGVSIIDWGPEMELDAGSNPEISLSRNGDCLVIFAGTGSDADMVFFRAGKVDFPLRTVEWFPRVRYDSGQRGSAAMADDGTSLAMHVSARHLFSKVGR